MITDADIKKLSRVFATKDDIQVLKSRLDTLEDNLTWEIAKLHDENLVTSTYRAKIEDHENRLIALENQAAN